MKTIIDAHPLLEPLLTIWKLAQKPLYKVKRWGKHHKKFPKLRRQSTLEHSHSINILVELLLMNLPSRHKIDAGLLRTAFLLHDFPEGILKRDVVLGEKTEHKDLAEYEAFKEVFEPLGPLIWKKIERAFLLQFASENPRCFPDHARKVMCELWKKRRDECLFFAAIERLDYIFYPLSHPNKNVAPYLFKRVICLNGEFLDEIVCKLPLFQSAIWSPSLSHAARTYGKQNGKPEKHG